MSRISVLCRCMHTLTMGGNGPGCSSEWMQATDNDDGDEKGEDDKDKEKGEDDKDNQDV